MVSSLAGAAMMDERGKARRFETTGLTAWDYAALKAAARKDFIAGHIVIHDGWILSRTEYDKFVKGAGDDTEQQPSRAVGSRDTD
jgi:hypothetical protein